MILFANNAKTTITDSPLADAATTINLTDGSAFPSPTGSDVFYGTLSDAAETIWEIVKVTARSTNALTVVRSQDGTTATGKSWPAGSKFEARLTKFVMNNLSYVPVDVTGNAALATTQSAWSGANGLDINGGAALAGFSTGFHITGNLYYNGTDWKAKATGTGGAYKCLSSGVHSWYASASVSAGATATLTQTLTCDASGNLTATANVTAYSDERLKMGWRDLAIDFTYRLSQVKHGTFDRIDLGLRQVGVSAQSLKEVIPEAVLSDSDGFLSVAYGNAALAACIELAREVVELKLRLAALEAK